MASSDPNKRIKSVDTVFDIIELINESGVIGLSQIANELEYSKSTIHYYIKTLEDRGYIIESNGEYRIGLRFLTLGGNALHQRDFRGIIEQKAENLAENNQSIAYVVTKEKEKAIFIYQSQNYCNSTFDIHLGMETQFHRTAYGKAILAYLPSKQIESIISAIEPSQRSASFKEESLYDELETIREIGFSHNNIDHDSTDSIAAPILKGTTNEVVGSIGITGVNLESSNPTEQFKMRQFIEEVPKQVQWAARTIGEKLTER